MTSLNLPPESSSAICRPAANGRRLSLLQLDASASATYKGRRRRGQHVQSDWKNSFRTRQLTQPGNIQALWSLLSDAAFCAPTKSNLMKSCDTLRRGMRASWSPANNSKQPGQRGCCVLNGGACALGFLCLSEERFSCKASGHGKKTRGPSKFFNSER